MYRCNVALWQRGGALTYSCWGTLPERTGCAARGRIAQDVTGYCGRSPGLKYLPKNESLEIHHAGQLCGVVAGEPTGSKAPMEAFLRPYKAVSQRVQDPTYPHLARAGSYASTCGANGIM